MRSEIFPRRPRLRARAAPALLAALLAVLGGARPAAARSAFPGYAPLGVAIKSGESAGGVGAQVGWNFSPHWQAVAGVGGANPLSSFYEEQRFRTDYYFLLGKYYFKHLYLATGYRYAFSRTRIEHEGTFYERTASQNGLPFHLGYEFGKRDGFFFSTSIGFLFIPDGGKSLEIRTPDGLRGVEYTTPATGPSVGLTLGYYFRAFP